MSPNSRDHYYMSIALRLAEKGRCTTMPNPAVGCVIVKDEQLVGEGWHQQVGQAHAEVNALQQAGANALGATAYITLEPCSHHGRTPPCSEAVIASGINRVVVAMQDPNPKVAGKGLKALQQQGIETVCGVLETQAEELNKSYCFRMRHNRPYVSCKLAMSLDGRTAMASGESKWITSEAARADVQRLRACSSAIMTGYNTVAADDPSLTVRTETGGIQQLQPVRVILDSQLRTSPDARMLGQAGRTCIFTLSQDDGKAAQLKKSGAELFQVNGSDGRVKLEDVLESLAQMDINDVLLEAGSILSGAMLQAGLINELIIYMAPKLMGDSAKGLFALPGLEVMNNCIDLDIKDIRAIGPDWRMTATVTGKD